MTREEYTIEILECDPATLEWYGSAGPTTVLLLPTSLEATKTGAYVFPPRTLDLLQAIREEDIIKENGIHVSTGIPDADFAQISLHSDDLSFEWVAD